MTAAILSPGAQLHLTLPPIDQMPEALDDVWRRPHYHTMSIPMNHYWPQTHGPHIGSVHDTEMRMLHSEPGYDSPFQPDASSMISPPLSYMTDNNFGSDMDVGTPSTSGFPDVNNDGYHHLRSSIPSATHLHPAVTSYERALSLSAHSPQSSIGGLSPHQAFSHLSVPNIPTKEDPSNLRPPIGRSITAPAAPEQFHSNSHHHRSSRKSTHNTNVTSATPSIKRSGSEDDGEEDDDYIPANDQTTKPTGRGRKRQRIPHTAVERRYRENLNAHLDKLRQTIPALASKKGKFGEPAAPTEGGGNGGVKPSKCEVLIGAIEYIGVLGKENTALRTENKALRARMDELERWVKAAQQQQQGHGHGHAHAHAKQGRMC